MCKCEHIVVMSSYHMLSCDVGRDHMHRVEPFKTRSESARTSVDGQHQRAVQQMASILNGEFSDGIDSI